MTQDSSVNINVRLPGGPNAKLAADLIARYAAQVAEAFASPEKWIAGLEEPNWDTYFLATMSAANVRSPDQQSKQSCMIVDWDIKISLGTGYNGHPCGATHVGLAAIDRLPTVRAGTMLPNGTVQGKPDKYAAMIHSELNAAIQAASRGPCNNAVMYQTMNPCEGCLQVIRNLRLARINVRRVVYLEHRDFPNADWLQRFMPDLRVEQYHGPNPAEVLETAAIYAQVRLAEAGRLAEKATRTYT